MSLYGMQKFLFHLNRDARVQQRFKSEPALLLEDYTLNAEEHAAIVAGDIGLMYVLGANGQLLMHLRGASSACRGRPTSRRCATVWRATARCARGSMP